MTVQLYLEVGARHVEIDVDPARAPRTWSAIEALLPLRTDLHYARIAGQEIMFMVPLLVPLENATDIQELGPGSVAYWPDRQLVCLYYGPLQDEATSATVLGRVRDLEPLRAIGEAVRARQGAIAEVAVRGASASAQEWPGARMDLPNSVSVSPAADSSAAALVRQESPLDVVELSRARERLSEREPADVAALRARRGTMQPAGPLLYAEAESRLLHEQLSMIVLSVESGQTDLLGGSPLLQFMLRRAAGRLEGWYLLHEAGNLVERAAQSLEPLGAEGRLALLRALALYIGRLNYWLDLAIPWNDVNELMRAAQNSGQSTFPHTSSAPRSSR